MTAGTPEAAVRCRGLTVFRGKRAVLAGIDLDIAPGERVAVVGTNGAGKSTLLLALGGLLPIRSGTTDTEGPRELVLQRTGLDRLLTIRENAALFARIRGLQTELTDTRIVDLAERFGLTPRLDERVGTLSGGLARRADLLRACVTEPAVLLLDEPTAGLDPPSARAFGDAIGLLQTQRAVTVVWATHSDAEARAADRVLVLHQGAIAALGTPATLLGDHQHSAAVTVDHQHRTIGDAAEVHRIADTALRQGRPVSIEPVPLLEAVLGRESP